MTDFNIVIDFREEETPEVGIYGVRGNTGPAGPQGEKGEKGDKGDPGEPGVDGAAGPQGPKGEKGDTGSAGPQGPKGDTGEPGPKGETGDTGATGPRGLKGDKGDTGATGETGPQGIQGPKGEKGDTGEQGPQGIQGPAGQNGTTPVKGTDYWTAEDKAEIVEDVVEEIDLSDYVKNTDYATANTAGVIKLQIGGSQGLYRGDSGNVSINRATENAIKAGIHNYQPIVPSQQHASAFYGLAKAAGDTTQSASSNAVGNYTENAKTKIREMLGIGNELTLAEGTADEVTVTAAQLKALLALLT